MNKWDLYYKKTIENIENNIISFAKMILFYYKVVIINKENDELFIKSNYNLNIDYNIFKKHILENKNIAVFTIFSNIPDCFHPLTKEAYKDYGSYISFIDPLFFNYSENNIIVKNKNIFDMDKFEKPIINQDIAPYNKNKRFIYINIKYFSYDKYKDNLLIVMDKNKNMYIINKSIIQKKVGNIYKIINIKLEDITSNLIYVAILRKINKSDILNIFDTFIIKKDTPLYSYHNKDTHKEIYWYSLVENSLLNDPYEIFYKESDELYKYTCYTKKRLECLNLSIDIFSKLVNKNLHDISKLITNNSKETDIIYNGNLNYIIEKDDANVWQDNRGKRLLNEIFFKSHKINVLGYYYFNFLSKYGINIIVNSYGYYSKLDKFYPYEVGFETNPNNYVKMCQHKKILIKDIK
jgi:hypothetical protein